MDKKILKDENIEPGVIDNAMITKCLMKFGPKGEAGRLYSEETGHVDTAPVVRMEFQNIIRIDHLWMLMSLRQLSLAHNKIEKIENLDQLTLLTELDLSFNKISKIENLDKLVHLEVLTLFHNKIRKLENLETLENLLVFSIGENLILDYMEFSYLRRFRFLRSVCVRGNPCCTDRHADKFIKSALVKVDYLDYKIITREERAKGREKFRKILREMDEEDEVAEKKRLADEEYKSRVKFYSLSFVEHLDGPELFESMFEKDPDGTLMLEVMNKEDGGVVLKDYEQYKAEYVMMMEKLVQFAHDSYLERQHEVEEYKKLVDSALADSVTKSQAFLAEYEIQEAPIHKEMLEIIQNCQEKKCKMSDFDVRFDVLNDKFNEIRYDLWRGLMEEEMKLFEQCEESRVELSSAVSAAVARLLERARDAFGRWRARELLWSTALFQHLPRLLGDAAALEDASPECLEMFSDREVLWDSITQSSDNHMRFIDTREDTLNARATQWRDDLVKSINENEIKRNRDRVLEISYIVDSRCAEWVDMQLKLAEPTESETELFDTYLN